MRCKKFKEKIILNLYGELPEREKSELEKHIKECAECARDLEYTKKVFKAVEYSKKAKIPEANWERAWQGISSTVEEIWEQLSGVSGSQLSRKATYLQRLL